MPSLHKQMHDKRGTAESLHAYITRAKLTVYMVGIFSREITQLSKIHLPLLEPLKFTAMGVFWGDYVTGRIIESTTIPYTWVNKRMRLFQKLQGNMRLIMRGKN